MKAIPSFRLRLLLWIAAVVALIADWLFPISDPKTRLVGAILVLIIWFGVAAIYWPIDWLRYVHLVLTLLIAGFLFMPARRPADISLLRDDVATALQRYKGVRYIWGGESPEGIDCSGLMRRGVIDGLFLRGIENANPGLIRSSIRIWWHDSAAVDMGRGRDQTRQLFSAPSINRIDQSKLQVGDMAVKQDGSHVLAYLGEGGWIEALPDAGIDRVIIEHAPDSKVGSFDAPVNIVRWRVLDAP